MEFGAGQFTLMGNKLLTLKLICPTNLYNKSILYRLTLDIERIFRNLLKEINNKHKSSNNSLKKNKEGIKSYVIKNNDFFICYLYFIFIFKNIFSGKYSVFISII